MEYRIILQEWGIGGSLVHHVHKQKEAEYTVLLQYIEPVLAGWICSSAIVVNMLIFFLDNPTTRARFLFADDAVSKCK